MSNLKMKTLFSAMAVAAAVTTAPMSLATAVSLSASEVPTTASEAVELVSISATNPTVSTVQSMNLDTTGIVVTAHYSDNSEKTVTGWTHNFTKTDAVGNVTVTITYQGKTCDIVVNVVEATATSISASYNGTTLYTGNTLNKDNIKVVAKFNNGTQRTLSSSEWTCDFTSASTSGTYKVTITYGSVSTTASVRVTQKPISYLLATNPTKSTIQGAELDTTGIVVVAVYTDGTSETITNWTHSYNSSSTVTGNRNISIYYGGKSTTITVNVKKASVSYLSAYYNGPTLNEGETIDKNDIIVYATYNNGKTETVKAADFTCSFSSGTEAKTYTATVRYSGKTASIYVPVRAKILNGISATYSGGSIKQGETLDTSKVKVYAVYDNGTTALLDSSVYSIDFKSSEKIGTNVVTVGYQYHTCTFNIQVTAKNPKITLSDSSYEVNVAKSVKIAPTLTDVATSELTYTSSDPSIFTVTANGLVKGISKGTATLTVSNGTVSATTKIVVKDASLKFNTWKKTMNIWGTYQLETIMEDVDASDLVWTSSNEEVAVVSDSGKVVAIGTGKTCIKATNGIVTAKCVITVKQPIKTLKASVTKKTLSKGKSFTLKYTIAPSTTTNQAVTFKSSNTKVATVTSKGVVKAVGKGTCTITITSKDNAKKTATVTITVK